MASRQEALQAIRTLIEFIGDDPDRPGLQDTPERVLGAWEFEWGSGYRHLKPIMRLFKDGADGYQEVVLVRDIAFFSHCEHHMTPFFGTAAIGYLPNPEVGIVGLSKLARAVEHFSRRLQVQERLTEEIHGYLADTLKPRGLGIIMRATHLCMVSRGVCQPHAQTITSKVSGLIQSSDRLRAEFLKLAGAE